MKQNRLKSPVLWAAVAGIILLALRHLGLEAEVAQGSQLADILFQLVCALLAALGVVNNPTDKNHL